MLGERCSLSNGLTCLGPLLTRTEEARSAHSGLLLLMESHTVRRQRSLLSVFFFFFPSKFFVVMLVVLALGRWIMNYRPSLTK